MTLTFFKLDRIVRQTREFMLNIVRLTINESYTVCVVFTGQSRSFLGIPS